VPKTYVVKVQGDMKEVDRLRWEEGVTIDGQKTRPAEVFVLRHEQGKTWAEVTIYEGRNQQIRKMGEATGFPVMRLARVAFAGITAEGLRPGEYRSLVREELIALRERFGVPRRLPKSGAPLATNVARGPAPRVRKSAAVPTPSPEWHPETSRGAERGPSRGAERGANRGAERGPSRGAERGPSRGAERGPSRGAERGPSRGAERGPSRGAERGPSRGAERGPSRGAERGPNRGAERGPNRGAERGPSRGAERGPTRGPDRGPDRGPNRAAGARGTERRLTGRARPSTRKNGG
jgi:23S rRNA pseudouridine2605 synthase